MQPCNAGTPSASAGGGVAVAGSAAAGRVVVVGRLHRRRGVVGGTVVVVVVGGAGESSGIAVAVVVVVDGTVVVVVVDGTVVVVVDGTVVVVVAVVAPACRRDRRRRRRDGDRGTGAGVLQGGHVFYELRQVLVLGGFVGRQREGGLRRALWRHRCDGRCGSLTAPAAAPFLGQQVGSRHAEVLLCHHAIRTLGRVRSERLGTATAHEWRARVQPAVDVFTDRKALEGTGRGADDCTCRRPPSTGSRRARNPVFPQRSGRQSLWRWTADTTAGRSSRSRRRRERTRRARRGQGCRACSPWR